MNKQEILRNLRHSPVAKGIELPTPVIYGLTTRMGALDLVDVNHRNELSFKRGIDPRRQTAARKRLYTFRNNDFLRSVNKTLQGGDSYPVLTSILGIAAGMVSAGAGLMWTAVTTGVALADNPYPVLVREGDEVWTVEVLTKEKVGFFNEEFEVMHNWYLLLVDTYRKEKGLGQHTWFLHEERRMVNI